MRVLVTGGAGFIGSHFVECLAEDGHKVLVVDDLSSGAAANLDSGIDLLVGDFASNAALLKVQAFRPDFIFHFAAQISVPKSITDPVGDAAINILATLKLLEAARAMGTHLVFASSGGAIYGEAHNGAQDENHSEYPLNPYGVAKLAIDRYLLAYHHQYGLPYTSLRLSNIFGPKQSPKGEAGVVAVFIKRLIAGHAITVNGDGEQTRDFLFVRDLAAIAPMILRQRPIGIFNLGTGQETSINCLADTLRGLFASTDPVLHGPALPGEQRRSILNASKARTRIGWKPNSSLQEGLIATKAWFEHWGGSR